MSLASRFTFFVCSVGLVILLFSTNGRAQSDAQQGEFSVQRFEPAPGPRNYLSVTGGRTAGEWAWSAGLWYDYAHDPFVLRSCESPTNCDDPGAVAKPDVHVVRSLFTWNVMGSLTPIPRLQLGLRFPVMLAIGDGVDVNTGDAAPGGLSAVGAGDPALEGKVRIVGEPKDPAVVAAALDVKAPLGHATAEGSYIGDASPVVVGLRGIVDGNFGPMLVALNLKGIYREEATIGATSLGPEFRYGVAAGGKPMEELAVFAEGFGATKFSGAAGTNSLEILAGVHYTLAEVGLVLTAGGGPGVVQGIGVPVARGVFGVSYVSEGAEDADGDGVPDAEDECPGKAEDADNVQDDDGCPEEDPDHDNIPDSVDLCPEKPETVNRYKDDDGCPDSFEDKDGDGIGDAEDKCPDQPGTIRRKAFLGCPDTDKDGVADKQDRCPEQKEDTDGFADTDGCPDPDNDQDGVEDSLDECADEPEIMNGVEDTDGCPDEAPDGDGDGIADDVDKCPDQAEVLNGQDDDDGCPEYAPKLAEVSIDEVELRRDIRFAEAAIADEPSRRALDALAAGLNNHQTIFLVRVTVTTTATDAALGRKRAEAVVAHLVGKGVKQSRLQAHSEVGDKPGTSFTVRWSTRKPKSKL